MHHRPWRLGLLAAALALGTGQALAQTGVPHSPTPPGLWERPTLLGDFGGLRTALSRYGITLGLQDASELFASTSGGIKHGASLDGAMTLTIGADTEKAFGWPGGLANLSLIGSYGPDFSQGYLGTLQTASGVVAAPTVRLWELWYQQSWLKGRVNLRMGLQSIDQEFMVSQGSSLFLNTVMGWPMVPTADLYGGGPAYPLSSLGLRLTGHPTRAITVLGGVFQDNPPGGPFAHDGQLRGATRYGLNFNLRTGALVIAELQYAINPPADDADGGSRNTGLQGTYKLGFWFDTAAYPDQRLDSAGRSLAAPDSTGVPLLHAHNYSVYAVMDQTIWHAADPDPRAVSLFLRPMLAPANRNLVDFSVNGGMTLKAPLPNRHDDTFGIGFGVANVSARASALDRDTARFSGEYVPVRGAETFLEVTYQMQVTPWLQLQPDFQYVWMPGGGVADPLTPGQRIGNEAVVAIRATLVL